MNDLFPGNKRFTSWNEKGEIANQWGSKALDWTAKVVCKTCNETWMSQIESKHAKPAMTDLIRGKTAVPVSQSRADSIAFFAFKTALIFDYIQRKREPFLRAPFAIALSNPWPFRLPLTCGWLDLYRLGRGKFTRATMRVTPPPRIILSFTCVPTRLGILSFKSLLRGRWNICPLVRAATPAIWLYRFGHRFRTGLYGHLRMSWLRPKTFTPFP